MAKVTSLIGQELYKIEIKSPTGNIVIADEPIDKGGKDKGFSPKELLAAALAACTSATVRMYADNKKWELTEVHSEIDLDSETDSNKTIIKRKISFIGSLTNDQKQRLLKVANACPIHKILSNPIEIETQLI